MRSKCIEREMNEIINEHRLFVQHIARQFNGAAPMYVVLRAQNGRCCAIILFRSYHRISTFVRGVPCSETDLV